MAQRPAEFESTEAFENNQRFVCLANNDDSRFMTVQILEKKSQSLLTSVLLPHQTRVKIPFNDTSKRDLLIRYKRWRGIPDHPLWQVYENQHRQNAIWQQSCSETMLFLDGEFPAHERSISNDPMSFSSKWCRSTEIYPRVKYAEDFHHKDVIQGQTGDCWLLSALICLSEKKNYLQTLITKYENNCFKVKLWKSGELYDVHVDDLFPCYLDDGQPIFCHSRTGDIWAMLIEKAYAKLYGSYTKLDGGFPMESLSELTGCPSITQSMEGIKTQDERQKIWTKMCESYNAGFLIITGTYPHNHWTGKKQNERDEGFVAAHAYAVIRIDKSKITLRNPWGWLVWSKAHKFNTEEEDQGGEFEIDFDHYFENFRSLTICYHQKFQETRYRSYFHLDQNNKLNFKHKARLQVKSPSTFYFSLYQANEYEVNSTTKLAPISLGLTVSHAEQPDNIIHTCVSEPRHQVASFKDLEVGFFHFEVTSPTPVNAIFNVETLDSPECIQEIFNIIDLPLQKTVSMEQILSFFQEVGCEQILDSKHDKISQSYESVQDKLTFNGFRAFWKSLLADKKKLLKLKQNLIRNGRLRLKSVICAIQAPLSLEQFEVMIL